MSKKELAARMLDNGIARFWSAAGGRYKGVRILAYHRVLDDEPGSFPFDDEVISARTEAFREQMKFARRNFDIVSFRDLRQCETEGRAWPERGLIVTFDDGYSDNYSNAFPVLEEMGIPATIFLTTSHIGQKKLFWWDQIAYSVKQASRRSIHYPELSSEPVSLASAADRRRAIGMILDYVKEIPEETRLRFQDRLYRDLDARVPDAFADRMHLSWDEVRAMSARGIDFGSHTMTHPILSNVTGEQLEEEVSASKKAIEQNTGKEVLAFAYPAGRVSRFNKIVQEAVARAGYAYAVSYEEGLALQNHSDRYRLSRIHVERGHSPSLFRANVMFPGLMFKQELAVYASVALAFSSWV
ncbi:MAG TPA: polysaccharide deacetylase family protein [Blastocatellia bacterium]|nr:polysaccharide deacetylase family protein [Blastocatellia bacterium]